jgi:thymidylate synthase (FAD)
MNDITKNTRCDWLERPAVEAIDAKLGVPLPVLDHGFVRVVDYMGDDAAVVQAARVSYGKGTKTPSDDRGLIRYLLKHRHTTPFEMCEIKLHVKLPIFVARQWIRHRTANVNEYSARYSILAREFYVPAPHAISPQSKTNRQGRNGDLPAKVRQAMAETIRIQGEIAYDFYEELFTGWPWFDQDGDLRGEREDARPHHGEHGMARELARMVLPVNAYTEWYWKIDLHNLMHFLALRTDPHAQAEIRAYADAIMSILQTWVPISAEAFDEYLLGAETFSRSEMAYLRHWIADVREAMETRNMNGLACQPGTGNLSAREARSFLHKLGIGDG